MSRCFNCNDASGALHSVRALLDTTLIDNFFFTQVLTQLDIICVVPYDEIITANLIKHSSPTGE